VNSGSDRGVALPPANNVRIGGYFYESRLAVSAGVGGIVKIKPVPQTAAAPNGRAQWKHSHQALFRDVVMRRPDDEGLDLGNLHTVAQVLK